MLRLLTLNLLALVLAAGSAATGMSQVATVDSAKIAAYNAKQFVHYVAPFTVDQVIDNAKDGEHELLTVSSPKVRQSDAHTGRSNREAYLRLDAANADLVVVGEPTQRNSGLTQGNMFVFSDYLVSVDQVYASKDITVLPGQSIVVARAGGIVQYRGKQITGSVLNFPLFHLHEKYVIFLRFVPETGSFIVFAEAAFNVEGETVSTRENRYAEKEDHPREEFLEDVRKATTEISQKGQK